MQRRVDLHGLSHAEAEATVREFIDEIQRDALEDFEITMTDYGTDRDEIDAALERQRAELRVLRDAALARLHALLQRGGGTVLH